MAGTWVHPVVAVLLAIAAAMSEPPTAARRGSAPAAARLVQLTLRPAGARAWVDGSPVAWFGATLRLAPGAHELTAEVPGSRCCEPLVASIAVEPAPAGAPQALERFVFQLPLRPAGAVLVGGPCRAVYACPGIGLVGAAGRIDQVMLPAAQWIGTCDFAPVDDGPMQSAVVALQAGELNAIAWPASPPAQRARCPGPTGRSRRP